MPLRQFGAIKDDFQTMKLAMPFLAKSALLTFCVHGQHHSKALFGPKKVHFLNGFPETGELITYGSLSLFPSQQVQQRREKKKGRSRRCCLCMLYTRTT